MKLRRQMYIMFGITLHTGTLKTIGSLRFKRGEISRTLKDTGEKVRKSYGQQLLIKKMYGISYKNKWFIGIQIFDSTVNQDYNYEYLYKHK